MDRGRTGLLTSSRGRRRRTLLSRGAHCFRGENGRAYFFVECVVVDLDECDKLLEQSVVIGFENLKCVGAVSVEEGRGGCLYIV